MFQRVDIKKQKRMLRQYVRDRWG